MNRTETRELTFKLLYSNEIQKDIGQEQVDIFIEEFEVKNENEKKYIKETFDGICKNLEEIVGLIEKNLKEKWSIDRISKIDTAILKLAIYELLNSDVPYKVVINEAVELAKKYGDDSSKSFVNGILASIEKDKNIS